MIKIHRNSCDEKWVDFIFEVVYHFSEEYSLPDIELEFRNRSYGSHEMRNYRHYLIFGEKLLENYYQNGYSTYRRLDKIFVRNPRPRKFQALLFHTIHEITHLWISARDLRRRGDQHGRLFQKKFWEFLDSVQAYDENGYWINFIEE